MLNSSRGSKFPLKFSRAVSLLIRIFSNILFLAFNCYTSYELYHYCEFVPIAITFTIIWIILFVDKINSFQFPNKKAIHVLHVIHILFLILFYSFLFWAQQHTEGGLSVLAEYALGEMHRLSK
jgi:hypothetical protein